MFNHLNKSFEYIQPYINDQERLITPNCVTHVKTHFHQSNFSSQTQKYLLCQTPIYNKSNRQISNHLPNIPDQTNSNKEKYFQAFLNEHQNQLKNNERKIILLKQFDELKHTINDPHSTLSVLAALSRALLYLDSEIIK